MHYKNVLLLLLVLVACGPSPTPTLTAKQIAQNASDKMSSVTSFHFSIELTGRRKTIDPLATLALRHAEGDVVRPNKAQSRIKVSLGGIIAEVRAVGIGEKQWLTNPLTQRWETAPAGWGYNPAVLFDAQTGLSSLLTRVEGLGRTSDETLDGQRHYRLSGKVAAQEAAMMTANMVSASDVSFTTWIGADDFLMRKIHIVEKGASEPESTEWDIVLSAFDKPVTIEAPSLK